MGDFSDQRGGSNLKTPLSLLGHYNKATGDRVPTPHIQERGTPGGVRPARSEEIPK